MPGAPPATFLDVAFAVGLRDVPAYGRGAAFADFDGDGWEDLFAADTDNRFRSPYGVSQFLRNRGDGTFTPVDLGVAEADLFGTWGGSFADYDGDGDADVVFFGAGYTGVGPVALYENRMGTEGRFVNATLTSGVGSATPQSQWWGGSWGDYDLDGRLDLVLTRISSFPVLLHNLGGGKFEDVTASAGILGGPADDTKNPLWYDFDEDGDPDLYVAGIQRHAMYENRGGTFVDVTAAFFGAALVSPEGWPVVFSASVADFDQDGHEDLYLGRWDRQDLVRFNEGGGRGTFLGAEAGLVTVLYSSADQFAPLENTMGLGVGDLGDDGLPDVFIGTGNPETAARDIAFCNLGGRRFERCTERLMELDYSNLLTYGHGVAYADVDHDGSTELFVNLGGHPIHDQGDGHDSRQYHKLFTRSPKVDADTATLLLEGTRSNRDAFGARVRVESGEVRYYSVRSTQGFQSQNARAIVAPMFGATEARVVVTWPSGTVSETTVTAGERKHVVEPP